ncbi:MAG: RidA family protein [Gemmatimonadota bacterium]|jgi:isochorismate pyruvate lyase|nr:RidA family protein [Gemmatimonadota bacterium]|tara:strand:+ start:166 stop:561 length:396 start_codon:yes stop_codon:yes gene_type:complete
MQVSFQRSFSGAPWESQIGYCRALRADDQIFITGTAPVTQDGAVHAPGDGYEQTIRCLDIIQEALASLGAGIEHVVRTRIFVTDIERWEEYGKAHREFFGLHPPATTLVEVRRLIHPDMLIEIEADAVVRE